MAIPKTYGNYKIEKTEQYYISESKRRFIMAYGRRQEGNKTSYCTVLILIDYNNEPDFRLPHYFIEESKALCDYHLRLADAYKYR